MRFPKRKPPNFSIQEKTCRRKKKHRTSRHVSLVSLSVGISPAICLRITWRHWHPLTASSWWLNHQPIHKIGVNIPKMFEKTTNGYHIRRSVWRFFGQTPTTPGFFIKAPRIGCIANLRDSYRCIHHVHSQSKLPPKREKKFVHSIIPSWKKNSLICIISRH